MTNNNLGSDEFRALALLEALAPRRPDNDRAPGLIVTHYGAPRAWQRPRLYKGRYITDKEVRGLVRDWTRVFTEALEERPISFGNLALVCLFYLPTRQVVDADNLTKLVMDAATKAHVWEDDSQVTAQASLVEYAPAGGTSAERQPRSVVAICPMLGTLDRTVPQERRRRPSLPLTQVTLAGR